MLDDDGLVVVEDGLCHQCAVSTKQIHHRNFPEIRAECGSALDGATHLARRLSLYREGAQNAWHRELLDRAIADVTSFLEALAEEEEESVEACRCDVRVSASAGSPSSGPIRSEPREDPGTSTPIRDVESAGGVASPC
ncbi:hypothetical protein ACYOEI_32715 [Singulisphaera rosea]